jgi:glutaminyl-tRNA synthetase
MAPRTFGVLDPITLEIENFDDIPVKEIEAPLFPADKNTERGVRKLVLSRKVFIEKSDFCEKGGDKSFFGLTPEQAVGLKYGPVVEFVSYSEADKTVRVKALIGFEGKLKGHLHWVSEAHSTPATVRLYNYLFTDAILKEESAKDKKKR